MFNEGFLPFPDVNDFDVIMIYQSVILSVSLCYYTLYSLSVFSLAESSQLILKIRATYRFIQSTLALRTPRYYGQNPDPGKTYRDLTENDSRCYGLSLLRNYGHFLGTKVTILLFWLSIKRTRCTSHVTLLCKITVYCSSFAKIHFKRSLECLLSHRFLKFLKLSAQSSSLLHSSLRFFLPGSLGELKPSCSILKGCLAVSVLLISSSSLGRYFGSPYSISSTFNTHLRFRKPYER